MNVLGFCLLVFTSFATRVRSSSDPITDESLPRTPKRVISLVESIEISRKSFSDPQVEEIRRQYWHKALEEIKNLSSSLIGSTSQPESGGGLFSEWKLFLDEYNNNTVAGETLEPEEDGIKLRRFEGFPSWERVLQDWTDDVQEYFDQIAAEGGEYSFSNFGRSEKLGGNATASATVNGEVPKSDDLFKLYGLESSIANSSLAPVKSKTKQFIPEPAKPGEAVLPHTNVADKSKRILVVTTASMPWRTGTAVNPLLRAAYLCEGRRAAGGKVILMVPWLEKERDQQNIYGRLFESPEDQEDYIRNWLRVDAAMPEASRDLELRWYTAWQNPVENSIYSMGDITALVPAEEVDICILEEPEHLNWYRAPGESWTKKFPHVVGILHTNYFQYVLDQPAALIRAPAMRLLCSWMCRAHSHRIIKLSGTLDVVAPEKELVENVHGVRAAFLDTGKELKLTLESSAGLSDPVFGPTATPAIYFIGKLLWSKGLGSLMELLRYAEESADLRATVDMYGGGPDKAAAEAKAVSLGLDMPFHGPIDHTDLASTHKIFINPSVSEVLCTTSAEALAMGKFVILPSHPSNDFFAQFPNCLTYTTKEEFVGDLYYAMTHAPQPMSHASSYALSWEAATKRLEAAACIPVEEANRMADALASDEAGIEITLPHLVESEEGRRAIATTLRYTRHRFRQFRTRLSDEIQQMKVLPNTFRAQLVRELNSRLDLDLDELLESPKLRVQLSPGELDKSLLELYDKLSESPGGDVLRVLCGGGPVALQNLYLKRQTQKKAKESDYLGDLFPTFLADGRKTDDRSASSWIRQALEHNLPRSQDAVFAVKTKTTPADELETENRMKMCSHSTLHGFGKPQSFVGLRPSSVLTRMTPRRTTKTLSLLI